MKSRLLLPIAVFASLLSYGLSNHHAENKGKVARIEAALPSEAPAEPAEERRLLVFSKTAGFRHDSIETGKLALTLLGEKTGAYTAIVSDDLDLFRPENIQTFDAICFLNTTREVFDPPKGRFDKMNDEQKENAMKHVAFLQQSLMDFIKGGGGFVGIHAATDTFYEWPEYGEMIGGYFDGHPWSAGTQVSIKVEPGAEENPIVAPFGGENISFKEEIYQFKDPYDSSELEMLLRLDTEQSPMDIKGIKRDDKDFGVAWTRAWGEGRVFYSSLGHNHHIFWNEKVLAHYLAGIQYALGDLEL